MKVSDLYKISKRDKYGNLVVDLKAAINAAFPNLEITHDKPNRYGHSGEITIDGNRLIVPEGICECKGGPANDYTGKSKHNQTAGTAIRAIESGYKKHNFSTLFLLSSYVFNGFYRSMKFTYHLLGRNEDGSFFVHRIRPKVGESGDMNQVRAWMWQLRDFEKLKARQGDLGFIDTKFPKQATQSEAVAFLDIGNHRVFAIEFYEHKDRIFALNPRAEHGEHIGVTLHGIYELRLARAWVGRGTRIGVD